MVKGANKVRTIDADALVAQWEVGAEEVEDFTAKMFIYGAIRDVKHAPTIEPEPHWIPIKWHYITDEEREESGYPKDWVYYLDCEMPEDGQEIIVTTKHGYVEKDVCYLDDGYSLDSGWDWIEDIVAWMEMPPVYHEDD